MNSQDAGKLLKAACAGLIACSLMAGCMTEQLKFSTLRISSTLPDLSQRQVLSNLARTASRPTMIPYFAMITDGISDVQDQGSFAATIMTDPRAFTKTDLNPSGSRTVDGNWSLKPTVNPDRLQAMRGAYHMALGLPVTNEENKMLVGFLGEAGFAMIPAGFACHGTKHDVPRKEAIYIDCFDGTYVWIMPDQAEAFSQFTLVIHRLFLNKSETGGLEQNDIAPPGVPNPNPFEHGQVPSSDLPQGPINQGRFFIPRGR